MPNHNIHVEIDDRQASSPSLSSLRIRPRVASHHWAHRSRLPAAIAVLIIVSGVVIDATALAKDSSAQAPSRSASPTMTTAWTVGTSAAKADVGQARKTAAAPSHKDWRNAKIRRVTDTADDGPGTLRWAVAPEPGAYRRVVLFDIAGRIDLADEIAVGDGVWIAGQSAPADGVLITGARLHVVGDDVIIEGLRMRPGRGPGQPLRDRDAISIGHTEDPAERVLVRRNTLSHAADETIAVWGHARDVRIEENLILDPIDDPKNGINGFAVLIGPQARDVTVRGNVMIGAAHRNPHVAGARGVEVVDNIIANYGPNATQVTIDRDSAATPRDVRVAGNLYIEGPRSIRRHPIRVDDAARAHLVASANMLARDGRILILDGVQPPRAPDADPGADDSNVGDAAPAPPALAEARRLAAATLIEALVVDDVEAAAAAPLQNAVAAQPSPRLRGDPRAARAAPFLLPDRSCLGTLPVATEALLAWLDARIRSTAVAPTAASIATDRRMDATALRDRAAADGSLEPLRTALGDAVLRAPRRGGIEVPHSAEIVHDGPPGGYDVIVGYFDESDGASQAQLSVDGDTVDTWFWTDGAGPYAGSPSWRIATATLTSGSTLRLDVMPDGGEPARIGAVILRPRPSVLCD